MPPKFAQSFAVRYVGYVEDAVYHQKELIVS